MKAGDEIGENFLQVKISTYWYIIMVYRHLMCFRQVLMREALGAKLGRET
jgi:hypothetical protein